MAARGLWAVLLGVGLVLGGCMQSTIEPASDASMTVRDKKLLAAAPYQKAAIPEPYRSLGSLEFAVECERPEAEHGFSGHAKRHLAGDECLQIAGTGEKLRERRCELAGEMFGAIQDE